MSNNEISRVDYDNVEFDDQLAKINGRPFTGIVEASFDNGQLEIELNYVDGLPSGIQRRWFSSGQLKEEWNSIRGQGSAWSRKWYESGAMMSERINENNCPVRMREWSDDGKLVSEMLAVK